MKSCGLKQVRPPVPATPFRFGTFGRTQGMSGGYPTAQTESWYVEKPPYTGVPPAKLPAFIPPPYIPGIEIPADDPFKFVPPGKNLPTPKPIPWKRLPGVRKRQDPQRSPDEQSWADNGDGDPAVSRPRRTTYSPGRLVTPDGPGREIDIGGQPNKPPVVRPLPGPHVRRPPGKREKERKIDAPTDGLAYWGRKAIGAITEGLDFVDAFYDALPDRYRLPWAASPEQKMRALYRHWDRVQMGEAIANLAYNHVEDMVIGKAQKATKEALKKAVEDLKLGPRFRIPGTGPSRMVDFL